MEQITVKVTPKKLAKILDVFSLGELKTIAKTAQIPVKKTKKDTVALLVENRNKLNQAIAIVN